MANRYKIEKHPQKAQIERDILKGRPYNEIASNYVGLSDNDVRRYEKGHMAEMLRHAQLETAEGLIDRIAEYTADVDKLFKSIEHYLEDPDNPGVMDFNPNASEIYCSYTYTDENGREYRKKETIQDILNGVNVTPLKLSLGITDPRVTLLKAAEVLNKQLELLAKARGAIKEETVINNNITTGSVYDILAIIKKALADYPEAQEALAKALIAV